MNAFAGFVALDGAPIASEEEASAARAITALHGGRTVARRVAGAAFVQRVRRGRAPRRRGASVDWERMGVRCLLR